MFNLQYQIKIMVENVPIQWIPKIEIYYPDLPQFPIMYIHSKLEDKRLIACPVSVSYEIKDKFCDACFTVLCNLNPSNSNKVENVIQQEIQERIGISKKITLQTIINCCKGNKDYEGIMSELWKYIEMSYGASIPFGKFYEEIYSIPRFVAAWQPKTGRQSEMRMLYNFMSTFGEEVLFPNQWNHLEYYVIPTYNDVKNSNYTDFPLFYKLYKSIKKLYELEFTNTYSVESTSFKVMPKAWKQNKDDFIKNVSSPLLSSGKFDAEDKFYAEKLVDAFNRHAWRAAYFISSFLNIETTDYKMWSKGFFKTFYENGSKLKGYSEKVIACYLQQGFGKEEIIPIDTWIETFYHFPLGIETRSEFYENFDGLGKIERVIWLASQSNKTNMKNFFDILWCQRYGVIGNSELRGVNPLACCCCKLNSTCIGLKKILNKNVLISNTLTPEKFVDISYDIESQVDFICLLEDDIPKKTYKKMSKGWVLVDEFSGYIMTEKNKISSINSENRVITVSDFIYR
ncbi:hypothetical protein [Clostridioides sp. ZZV15-6598]|uniref:hypothetical protein n=1 Tax=Clostridioides sp. ZZV15-6598 TaxID=2811501 RepID=UPI001D0FD545|nr:hypothetical protein [Clostridioides sp. ZZV15-6598]